MTSKIKKNSNFEPEKNSSDKKFRIEFDSLGQVDVPGDRLWGAQTQRALKHFPENIDYMPQALFNSYGYVKKAAALVNRDLGKLSDDKACLIAEVCDEIIQGKLDKEFPLSVWQMGAGTQANMNINEVIVNRARQIVNAKKGHNVIIHPNDDVNMSQSSNDTFPTAAHIALVYELVNNLIPAASDLTQAIAVKAFEWAHVVKVGRTQLQDAVPLTVGQEWSGYVVQLGNAVEQIKRSLSGLYELAIGGTAIGTGINAPKDFAEQVANKIASLTNKPFVTAPNKFAAIGGADAMLQTSAALRSLAVVLLKIANDIRLLGSGPRSGFNEFNLPINEPGSSIMPGKVNPTQPDAMVMICMQVIGYDLSLAFAASQGHFELNVAQPMIINNVFKSASLLAQASLKFKEYCIVGISLNLSQITKHVNDSLILVTSLSEYIGYEKAAQIVYKALTENINLRDAAISSGYIISEKFDEIVIPSKMIGNPIKDLNFIEQYACKGQSNT